MQSAILLADHAAAPSESLYGRAPRGMAQGIVFQPEVPQTF